MGVGAARSQICSKLMGHPGVQYAVTSFPESASLPLKTTPPCVLVDVVSFWDIACVSASWNGPISSSLKRIFPLRHVITSLLCVGVLIVSLKLVGKEAA